MKLRYLSVLLLLFTVFTASAQLKEKINTGIGTNKTIAPGIGKKVYNLPRISNAATEQLKQFDISKINTLNARLIEIAKEDLDRKKIRTWNINPKRPLLANLRFSYYGLAGGEYYFTIMPLKNPGTTSFAMFPGALYFENASAGKEYRLRMKISVDPYRINPDQRGRVFFGFTPANSYYYEIQQSTYVTGGTEEIIFLFKPEESGRVIIHISAFMFSGAAMNEDPKPLSISSITIEEL
jgi:hypothetical protein